MNSPHGATADEASLRYEGWPVVGVCFVVATFAWGAGFYGQGIYLAELTRIHGWPASLISTATTCYYLFGSALVVFVSEAMRALGPRLFLIAGILCMALGTALVGYVTAPWQLFLLYGLFALGWAGTSLAAINTTLGLWFDRRRGMAISLALNGASCGGILGVPLLVGAIGRFGFAPALAGAAVVLVVVAVPLILIFVGPPPHPVAATDPAVAAPSAARIRSEAFRTLSFWTIVMPFACVLMAQVGFIVHQISFLDPIIGRAQAGFAVSLMTVMAVVGRVGFGTVIDRLDQRKASAVSFASQAAALAVIINTRDGAALLAASAVFGFTVGNAITLPALILQREFSAASFGVLVSLVSAMVQVAYAFGPGLVGLARDVTGSYAVPFYGCMALELAAAAIVLMHGRRRK